MGKTSLLRRTALFRSISILLAALMMLGPMTAMTVRAGQRSAPPTVASRPTARPAPAPAQPALVPRRIRPQSLERLDDGAQASRFDPWSWFDGSAAPSPDGVGSVRVRATLAAPTKLIGL